MGAVRCVELAGVILGRAGAGLRRVAVCLARLDSCGVGEAGKFPVDLAALVQSGGQRVAGGVEFGKRCGQRSFGSYRRSW